MISKRVQEIEASGIRKIFDLASKIENPCNLSIGQPHFDVPDPIKQACINAINEGKNSYTQTQGIAELRDLLLADYERRGAPQEDLAIIAGVSGGISLALLALTDPGDEVIIPDPYFVGYKQLPKLFGVKPVVLDTYPDFRWRRDRLEAAITEKTRVIFLASPSNPTGITVSEEEIRMIADFARRHNLWVVYDEIYERFIYEGEQLSFSRYYDQTITLNGFSKSYSMTGWRIGSVSGPREAISQMLKIQQFTFVCAPSIAQWAALASVDSDITPYIDSYREKRNFMIDQLSDYYEIQKPSGAFYLFLKVPEGYNGEDFVCQALKQELLIIPGSIFSEKDTHFRVSFAASQEDLERGVQILQDLAKQKVEL